MASLIAETIESESTVPYIGFGAKLWLTADKHHSGELTGTIELGDAKSLSNDLFASLGLVYKYFLTQFASDEEKNGGQFYTPRGVVRVMVEMLAPYKGRVYNHCCGSAGMFLQSEKFLEERGGHRCLATTTCCYTGILAKPAGWSSRNSLVLRLRCRLPNIHHAEQRLAFDQQAKRQVRDIGEAQLNNGTTKLESAAR